MTDKELEAIEERANIDEPEACVASAKDVPALIAEVRRLRKALAKHIECATNVDAQPQLGSWLCSECEGCEKTGHREGCLLR